MDPSVVIDALGGTTASTLDALPRAGFSYIQSMAIKRNLNLTASAGGATAVSLPMPVAVPAEVCSRLYLPLHVEVEHYMSSASNSDDASQPWRFDHRGVAIRIFYYW